MTYTEAELFIGIGLIGLGTYLIRLVFMVFLPKISENEYIKSAMEAIAPAMLIALVIPFTIFIGGSIDLLRIEVLAIVTAAIFVALTKRPGLGILVAMVSYFVLDLFV